METIDYKISITSTSGQIGEMTMHIVDAEIAGVDVNITGRGLKTVDFAAIQAAYTKLAQWAGDNSYPWAS